MSSPPDVHPDQCFAPAGRSAHAARRSWLGAAAALLLLVTAGSAPAADLHVDPAGNDGCDCSSVALACRTIQRAVDVAVSGADVIHVAEGTYPGTITSDKVLRIGGAGAGRTILTGSAVARVVDVVSGVVTLQDLTVTAGLADEEDGGGIRNGGALTLIDVDVEDSLASSPRIGPPA